VTAEIRDSRGRKVATVALDPADTSGMLDWSGRMSNGSRAPDGAYTLSVVAQSADGSDVKARVGSVGRVQDVVVDSGATFLGVNGVNLPFASVARVTGS
jgi:flagellar basal-body rod modification protein FlgD